MTRYRITCPMKQKDGSVLSEAKFIKLGKGEKPPKGAVKVPKGWSPETHRFDEAANAFVKHKETLDEHEARRRSKPLAGMTLGQLEDLIDARARR